MADVRADQEVLRPLMQHKWDQILDEGDWHTFGGWLHEMAEIEQAAAVVLTVPLTGRRVYAVYDVERTDVGGVTLSTPQLHFVPDREGDAPTEIAQLPCWRGERREEPLPFKSISLRKGKERKPSRTNTPPSGVTEAPLEGV